MISLLLLGLIASAHTAPHFNGAQHQHHYHHGAQTHLSQSQHEYKSDLANFMDDFEKQMKDFDKEMKEFEKEMNEFGKDIGRFTPNISTTDLDQEIKQLEENINKLTHDISNSVSQDRVEGDKYIITVPLTGYQQKEISIKVSTSTLTIEAHHHHPEGPDMNYLHIRTLPDTVNVNGTWSYDKGVLKIEFLLEKGVESKTLKPVATDSTTKAPSFDEETVRSVDIDAVVQTHEIGDKHAVEATTYAVDLKNEVEFVPVKY